MNAACANVMREHFAKLVRRNLPDKSRLVSKPCKSRQGVGGRTTADFTGWPHMRIQSLRARFVDKLHAALCQTFACDKRIIGIGNDIHNRVTNCEYVETGISHQGSYLSQARPSGVGHFRQAL